MFFAIPIDQPGEYETAALIRERDELWRNRLHLTPGQGKQLDDLIRRMGHPERRERSMEEVIKEMQKQQSQPKEQA